MITQEYLEAMKADLLTTYAEDLCAESHIDIANANNVAAFISVLDKYTAFLKYKSIPTVEWARKWFDNYKKEAEECGCYLDVVRTITNPSTPITLFGTAQVVLVVNEPHIFRVTTQDDSQLRISAYGTCAVNVRQKDNSKVNILHKDNSSIVKIRKV